jgi:hypothetical protein
LVPITKVKPPEPKVPTTGSSGVTAPTGSKVNEEFEQLFESVSITISGDTVEEVQQAMKLLTSKEEDTKTESVKFSDDSSVKLLTLGKVQEQVLTEEHSHKQIKKLKDEYVTDNNGKIRVFMLRRAAAKEAHQNGGVVYKQGNGYVIKLKENVNVETSNKSIQEEGRTSSTGSTSGRIEERRSCGATQEQSCDCGCESGTETKPKISITQAKKAFKEKINEIDCGTEVGVSMSGAGENATRGGISTSPKTKSLKEFKK